MGEEYQGVCPASHTGPRTQPPVMGLWRVVYRVQVDQHSFVMGMAGGLAGLGGPESLPLTASVNRSARGPRLMYDQGEAGAGAAATAAYVLNSALEAALQQNLFVLQVDAHENYRAVIINESLMTGGLSFQSWWGATAFSPSWAHLYYK